MYHLTFRSADGSKYKLDCSKKTYHLLRKNTCGELSYRELFGNNLSFIGFVSTGEQASVRASAKRRTSKKPVVIRGGGLSRSVCRGCYCSVYWVFGGLCWFWWQLVPNRLPAFLAFYSPAQPLFWGWYCCLRID